MSDPLNVPRDSAGDWLHATVKGGIGAIPLAGGVAAEVFGLVLAPPVARRRDRWMEEVATRLKHLDQRGTIDLSSLGSNGTFVDTVMQATQSALKTQSELKRGVLRAAILNSARPGAPDAVFQQMFLKFVDQFTEWHIKLLDLLHDPVTWSKKSEVTFPELMMGSVSHIVEIAFPEMKEKRELYRQVWRDLHISGLLNSESPSGTMTWNGIMSRRTTDLGEALLKFVTEPGTTDTEHEIGSG